MAIKNWAELTSDIQQQCAKIHRNAEQSCYVLRVKISTENLKASSVYQQQARQNTTVNIMQSIDHNR